jgi:hypothetical protein
MFSAISATRLAMRDAIISYGDGVCGITPLAPPFDGGALALLTEEVLFDTEAGIVAKS